MTRLAGKVAMITGAGRGIGAAIASAFVREGAVVVLAELDIALARETAARIGSASNVLAVQTDVTQSASVQNAVSEGEAKFGAIDVLVNNAGINVFCDPLTMTDDDWRRCFAVDLDGVWNGCRAVLPGMVERGRGSIVNIAST
ncbi:SDR family NAD(P)-dependent oxidoreductase, partial [Caballeronia mineralivorans]